jgi:dCMP deaminase
MSGWRTSPPPELFMKKEISLKWHLRHLEDARIKSTWSKDPSTKVGAVIVDKLNRPVSWGFNGLSIHTEDSNHYLNNRELKNSLIIHAELNAILFARRDLTGCSIYVYPCQPCAQCASIIMQVGIDFIGFPKTSADINERWKQNFELAREILGRPGHVTTQAFDFQ